METKIKTQKRNYTVTRVQYHANKTQYTNDYDYRMNLIIRTVEKNYKQPIELLFDRVRLRFFIIFELVQRLNGI